MKNAYKIVIYAFTFAIIWLGYPTKKFEMVSFVEIIRGFWKLYFLEIAI